ncbi:hypothetical protein GOC74_05090 [Halomicrobium mukohataei]|uniref:Uncharacterized protein n=1 Tax=Halomicrobium mukohataei TaxID=57705 RepID=A0A847U7K5_9EURY|nr:hypothetical protein [Halomicrobium mukohataei]NLV09305.1 hypothetical protein [Halomicrobium mukohataei]
MSESQTEDDLNEKVEELENKIERIDERTNGSNQIRIQAYDLSIKASSEETGMRELLSMCSAEMEDLTERALIGQYQEIEREDLFGQIFGDD